MAKEPTPKITTKKHLARQEKERNQTRILLGGLAAVFLLVIGVIVYGILDEQYFQANRVVAQVGDTKITAGEFQVETRFNRYLQIQQYEQLAGNPILAQFYGQQIQQLESNLSNPQTIGKSTLDGLIDDAVIEQEAKARGITLTRCRDRSRHAGGLWLFRQRHRHPGAYRHAVRHRHLLTHPGSLDSPHARAVGHPHPGSSRSHRHPHPAATDSHGYAKRPYPHSQQPPKHRSPRLLNTRWRVSRELRGISSAGPRASATQRLS